METAKKFQKNKNPKIQVLRAISIIAVIMIHTCPKGLMQVYIRPFINFGVATFLFLSGYLTDVSKINIKEFYKRRITRVIIPYTIWSFLYTSVSFFPEGIDLKRYITNYLTARGAATMYYIFVYIQFVLLTPLLGKLLEKKYWYLGFVIAPVSLAINYYWLFNGNTPNKYISTIWKICCLGWFTFFYLGLYLKNKNNSKKYTLKALIPIYLLAIIVQMIEGYYWHKLGSLDCGTQLKMSSILTSSIFVLIAYQYINDSNYNGNSKFLLIIGNYSFGIYISHCMILAVLDKIIPFWELIPFGINSLIVLIITLLCTIIGKKICGEKLSRYVGLY